MRRPLLVTLAFVLAPCVFAGLIWASGCYPAFFARLGGIQTVLIAATALLTFYYVVLTYLMVREMNATREEEAKPFVVVDIEFDVMRRMLAIRNIGKTPAYDLTIEFEPPIHLFMDERLGSSFLSKPIAFLPPGTLLRTAIDWGARKAKDSADDKTEEVAIPHAWAQNTATEYKIRLSYRAAWQKKCSVVAYDLNLEYTKHLLIKQTADMNELSLQLGKIENHMETIAMFFRNEEITRHGIHGNHGSTASNLDGIKHSLWELTNLLKEDQSINKTPNYKEPELAQTGNLTLRRRLIRVLRGH